MWSLCVAGLLFNVWFVVRCVLFVGWLCVVCCVLHAVVGWLLSAGCCLLIGDLRCVVYCVLRVCALCIVCLCALVWRSWLASGVRC